MRTFLIFSSLVLIASACYYIGFESITHLILFSLLGISALFILFIYIKSIIKYIKHPYNKGEVHVIKKGRKRPSGSIPFEIPRLYKLKNGFKIDRIFEFTGSCFNNTKHINKLIGFSVGRNHHKQSYRVGWQLDDKKAVNISLYYYQDGERFNIPLCVVPTNMPIRFIMEISDDTVLTVSVKSLAVTLNINEIPAYSGEEVICLVPQVKWGYKLFIYYDDENDKPADKNMIIYEYKKV